MNADVHLCAVHIDNLPRASRLFPLDVNDDSIASRQPTMCFKTVPSGTSRDANDGSIDHSLRTRSNVSHVTFG